MYRNILITVALILLGAMLLNDVEAEMSRQINESTINIRTFIDENGNEIYDATDQALDNVTVCLQHSDGQQKCGLTGDAEYMFDSLAAGTYTATVQLDQAPLEGYALASERCSEHPAVPRDDICTYKEPGLVMVELSADEAINVNFNFQPQLTPTPTATATPTPTMTPTATGTPVPGATPSATPTRAVYRVHLSVIVK